MAVETPVVGRRLEKVREVGWGGPIPQAVPLEAAPYRTVRHGAASSRTACGMVPHEELFVIGPAPIANPNANPIIGLAYWVVLDPLRA